MFLGVMLLFIGIFWLLDSLNIVRLDFSEYILPVALIAFGISSMVSSWKEKSRRAR